MNKTKLVLNNPSENHEVEIGDVYLYEESYLLIMWDSFTGMNKAISLGTFYVKYRNKIADNLECVKNGKYITTLELEL